MTAALYQIRHVSTGRCYIGITQGDVRQRWHAHRCDARKGRGTRIARALAKYGFEAFDWQVLAIYPDRRAAAEAERQAIAERRPAFNITAGGDGVNGLRHSEAARAKMRGPRPALAEKCRARAQTAEGRAHLDRIRYTGGPPPGTVVSAETRAKMSASAKARCTAEFVARVRAMNAGRKASEETRAKLVAAHTKYPPGCACSECGNTEKRIRGFGQCQTCYARNYARRRRNG